MALEVTVPAIGGTFDEELKKLLSNKDKLVSKELKDGRNQYQVEIQKLKDKMKAYKKSGKAVEGEITSFGKLLKDVKKQERRGEFDRGAEGETKKKLRAQMATKKTKGGKLFSTKYKSGMHKGSLAESNIELEERRKESKKKKKESVGKSR
jgi:hypothetical protein|tara:strand:+ start:230 stop:682 length:453 start_codon:yes stop_codon:yes gene_type:complete